MTSQPDFIHDSEDEHERKREVKWEESFPLLGGGSPSSRQGSFLRPAPSTIALLHESDEELFDRQACFHECKRCNVYAGGSGFRGTTITMNPECNLWTI